MKRWILACACASMLGLGACGEKVQTIPVAGQRKADTSEWAASNSPYIAPGWKPGDRASWEAHLRARAQAQNDFAVAR